MSSLAIIPARGGSKRIPGKNVKDFLGQPIIAYSIDAAKKSCLFDEIMVSTEDEAIAQIACDYGANIPFMRSKSNAADHSTTMNVINEVLAKYFDLLGKSFQFVCCIYPAAPLINPNDIKQGYKLLVEEKFDSVFPIVAFEYPIWRALYSNENCKVEMVWPEFKNTRTQDIKKTYHDAGQWYWLIPDKIIDTIFTDNSGSIILEQTKTQDIDNPSDWMTAEIKYKLLHQ